jgi:hypothetical protein
VIKSLSIAQLFKQNKAAAKEGVVIPTLLYGGFLGAGSAAALI